MRHFRPKIARSQFPCWVFEGQWWLGNLLTTPHFLAGWAHYIPHDIKVPSNEDIPWSLLLEHRPAILLAPRGVKVSPKIHRCTRESHGEKGGSVTDPSDTSRDLYNNILEPPILSSCTPSKTKLNHLVRRTECKRLLRILIRSLVFESLAADLKNLRSESPKSPKTKFNTRNQPKF